MAKRIGKLCQNVVVSWCCSSSSPVALGDRRSSVEDRAEKGRRSDVESVREDLELNVELRRLEGRSAKEDCCPFPCRCFRFPLDVSVEAVVPVDIASLERLPGGDDKLYYYRVCVQHRAETSLK